MFAIEVRRRTALAFMRRWPARAINLPPTYFRSADDLMAATVAVFGAVAGDAPQWALNKPRLRFSKTALTLEPCSGGSQPQPARNGTIVFKLLHRFQANTNASSRMRQRHD
jgi:hypothetical protein